MKNPVIHLLRLGAIFLAAASATVGLHAQSDTARVKFSDPSKPGTLKFNLHWADVRITGTDGDEVVVTSSLDRKKEKTEVDKDGFRRLDEDVTFELKERNNVASISVGGDRHWAFSQGAEFKIQVPRNTNLIVRTQMGGEIAISNIDGEIDVNSMNGEVTLTDIGSSAVVNTMNGEVVANFRTAPTKPVSITTMNGEIDLRLPVETKANLRMRTHNGSIRTNFPDGVLVSKTESSGAWRSGGRENSELKRQVHNETRAAIREARNAVREAAREVAAVIGVRNSDRSPSTSPSPTPSASPSLSPSADEEDEDDAGAIAPLPPMPPIPGFSGKTITGTLNGGGVDISLSSMNGTITLRQIK